jgi:predicted alpha/beta hydrolase family esterase
MPSESADRVNILIVPGLYGSGPEHWQSQWQKTGPEFSRVHQRDWDTPVCEDWVRSLNEAIERFEDRVVLIGHSLGSVTIAHWAAQFGRKIVGALLVAPSDTEAATFPEGTTGFSPIPNVCFPFPSIVIGSTNDPYITEPRAEELSATWGSRLIMLGDNGHISTADGFGPWPEGLRYIAELEATARTR